MRRRWLTAAGAALAVTASAVTAAAGPARPAAAATLAVAGTPTAAATASTGQFGLVPAPGADGQPRGYFQLSVAPGSSVRDLVVIGNPSAQTQKLRLGMADGLTATNSGSAYGPLENHCSGTSCWVIGVPRTVTLAPRSQAAVRFEVDVPKGTKPAQYLTGIAATLARIPKPTPVASSAHGSAQVIVVPRVVIGVAVTVGKLDKLQVKTVVNGVTAGWVDGLVRLTVQVKNTGQRFTKGTGRLSCTNGGVTRSFPVDMDTVLPGQGAGLQVNGAAMHEGTWQCAVKVKAADGGTATWAGAVTVASTQPGTTKRVGPSAYVVPGGGGIPAWAIALMVLGALILLSLWAVLLRRQRNRNPPPPAA